MSDQLGLDDALFDVPNGSCCVDGSRLSWVQLRSNRRKLKGTKLAGFDVVENREGFNRRFSNFPETNVVAREARSLEEKDDEEEDLRLGWNMSFVGEYGWSKERVGWVLTENVFGSSEETVESDELMVEIRREGVGDKAMA
ncbi:hypothetical protein V6N13_036777 [Hibiscus sabdariffa]|uniref:Uncharacterized protein n=1 Tax=Hibiscus sabdariffa TaxID=183260 RepID=A0ABR2S5J6_9ROSI